jgi:hypothetical protein
MAEDQAIQNQRIAIESITHTQLLIPDDRLQLPVLDIGLPVVDFFFIAPILLLLMHTYFMIHVTQFAILLNEHRKQSGLSGAWRQEIDPSIFTGFFLREDGEWGLVEWLRDVFILISFWCVVPIVLCRIQLKFLPYHHENFTDIHKGCVLISLVLATLFYCKIKPMQRNMGFIPWAFEFITVFFKVTWKNFTLKWLKGTTHLLILSFSVFTILSISLFSWDVLSIPKNVYENEALLISSESPYKRIAQISFALIAKKPIPI